MKTWHAKVACQGAAIAVALPGTSARGRVLRPAPERLARPSRFFALVRVAPLHSIRSVGHLLPRAQADDHVLFTLEAGRQAVGKRGLIRQLDTGADLCRNAGADEARGRDDRRIAFPRSGSCAVGPQ